MLFGTSLASKLISIGRCNALHTIIVVVMLVLVAVRIVHAFAQGTQHIAGHLRGVVCGPRGC